MNTYKNNAGRDDEKQKSGNGSMPDNSPQKQGTPDNSPQKQGTPDNSPQKQGTPDKTKNP